jgi:hypothetical protein
MENLQSLAGRELESVQEETSDRTTFDPGPLLEEGLGGEREENGTEDEPDQPLPTVTDLLRPALLPVPHLASRITSNLPSIIHDADSLGDAAAQLGKHHLAMKRISFAENTLAKKALWKRWADVRTNLSTSPSCGNWQYVGYNLTGSPISLYQYRTDGAAKGRGVSYIDSCKPYYNRTISYSEEHNASCPFSGDVCLYGQTSAYALDIGFVDSGVPSINTAKRYQFRRRTICSPIVTNSPYIAYYHAANRTDLSPLPVYFFDEGTDPSVVQPIDFLYP